MIFSENNTIMHVTAQVTPVVGAPDTHFHSHHIAAGNNNNINSYHQHHHHLQHNQYPSSHQHQRQSSHSYDTIDTSVWQHSAPSSTLAANRYNSSNNVDRMGGTMSWSDDNSGGGSCVDDISEEEDNGGDFDENGRKKVVKIEWTLFTIKQLEGAFRFRFRS